VAEQAARVLAPASAEAAEGRVAVTAVVTVVAGTEEAEVAAEAEAEAEAVTGDLGQRT
jgi:hypothetical protein